MGGVHNKTVICNAFCGGEDELGGGDWGFDKDGAAVVLGKSAEADLIRDFTGSSGDAVENAGVSAGEGGGSAGDRFKLENN